MQSRSQHCRNGHHTMELLWSIPGLPKYEELAGERPKLGCSLHGRQHTMAPGAALNMHQTPHFRLLPSYHHSQLLKNAKWHLLCPQNIC